MLGRTLFPRTNMRCMAITSTQTGVNGYFIELSHYGPGTSENLRTAVLSHMEQFTHSMACSAQHWFYRLLKRCKSSYPVDREGHVSGWDVEDAGALQAQTHPSQATSVKSPPSRMYPSAPQRGYKKSELSLCVSTSTRDTVPICAPNAHCPFSSVTVTLTIVPELVRYRN